MTLASVNGLEGLTIGRLADELTLSKSGLFAHFGSKEALQVAVIDEAARQFVQAVMVPALREPRGEPRVRAMFERWMAWVDRPGGCFFISASSCSLSPPSFFRIASGTPILPTSCRMPPISTWTICSSGSPSSSATATANSETRCEWPCV